MSGGGLRLVEKSVEVLDLLAEHGDLSIAELAKITEEPRSSLYRLMASLEQLDLVEPADQRGRFRLGMHVLRLGRAVQAHLDVRSRALPTMQAIQEETGLTVYLVVRRGRQAVCVERVEGRRVAVLALQLGGALPLHVGAGPRALLAFGPESEWTAYLEGAELEAYTDRTPTNPDAVLRQLAEDRRRGYTVSDGDVTVGIAALGVPIRSEEGQLVAALSVSGLRDEVLDGPDLVETLRRGGETISSAMGYRV